MPQHGVAKTLKDKTHRLRKDNLIVQGQIIWKEGWKLIQENTANCTPLKQHV